MTDESIIIGEVLAGRTNAFATLVNRYKDLSITLAYNVLLNLADAEDVVQDAFIKSYSSLSMFKGDSKFSTWLYRIVLNTALNKQRSRKLVIETLEDVLPNDESTIEIINLNSYDRQQQKKYIQAALKNLSEGERICITLYYLNELSLEEIKELTSYSASNIKVLLFRGRKNLYQQLDQVLKAELKDLI